MFFQYVFTKAPGCLGIVNTTKNIVIFSDDFESGIIGEVQEVNDPKIGIWDWNKTPIVEICGLKKI